jgi:hypothetical protein
MTLNGLQAEQLLPSNPPSLEELNDTVSNYLLDDATRTTKLHKEVAEILFENNMSPTKDTFEVDEKHVAKYTNNHLFCRFYHLFEYEATYYSYLIAKVSASSLFGSGECTSGVLSKRDRDLIFVKPGETLNFAKEVMN